MVCVGQLKVMQSYFGVPSQFRWQCTKKKDLKAFFFLRLPRNLKVAVVIVGEN